MSGPSPGRQRLFTLLAVLVVPAALLLAAEGALRLAGIGKSLRFSLRESVDGREMHLRNPHFSHLFFEPEIARECHPFALPVDKPAESVRVFLLGASAANGIPEPAYGMGRMLEVLLRERHPEADIRVINVAITATNSHVTRRIASACADLEPDLFVLYLGNNEVVGPYGPGTVFAPLVSRRWMIDTDIAMRSTRIGQLVRRVARAVRPSHGAKDWKGLEMFTSRQVRADDPRMPTVYRHFRENVEDICATASRAKTPIVVSTVGVNLRDCAPFASLHPTDWSEDRALRWDTALGEAEAALADGSLPGALEAYRRAEAIDDAHAELHWRIGACLREMGRHDEALVHFERARDLDTLRFRADGRINAILRDVVRGRAGDGVVLAAAAESLAVAAPDRTPGREAFWEHVHLTFDGNYVVSRVLAERAEAALRATGRLDEPARDWPDRAETGRLLAYTLWDRVDVLRTVISMIDQAPFHGQRTNARDLARLRADVDSLAPMRKDSLAVIGATYEAALSHGRPHWLLRFRHAAFRLDAEGRADIAAEEWGRITREFPRFPPAWNSLARAQARLGRLADAERSLEESLRIDPYQAPVHANLGTSRLQQDPEDRRRRLQAIEQYERAVQLGDDPSFLELLSRVRTLEARHLGMEGREEEARAMLRGVLERDSGYAPARELLERTAP